MGRVVRIAILTAVAFAVVRPAPAGPAPVCDLDATLKAAGRYVREYQRAFSVVVSRERYSQRAFAHGRLETRSLESEVALVALDDVNWILFRDVVRVDGRAVQERADRLSSLFLKPSPDLGAQARRILEEGARYNIGPITRTLNTPTQALDFIRPESQSRSQFRVSKAKVDGSDTCELRFQETAVPRMIVTHDNAAATGRFWTLPDSGAIVRSELQLKSAGASALITVSYRKETTPDLWLPRQMIESYELQRPASTSVAEAQSSSATRVDGVAVYSGFKQFAVDSKAIIK